ncbi:transposase [Catenovulum sediminis]|nr:transposase [Catenovulum sediminis]
MLHTHSRQLEFHPHVHCIVPALALDKSGQLIKQKRGRYLFNAQNLAKVFRGKMHQALTDAKLKVPRSPKSWIADCQHVGQGEKALIYLSRYLYRGVIAEKNILARDKTHLTQRVSPQSQYWIAAWQCQTQTAQNYEHQGRRLLARAAIMKWCAQA